MWIATNSYRQPCNTESVNTVQKNLVTFSEYQLAVIRQWIFHGKLMRSPVAATTVLSQKEHKTPQAAEKANDLSCYVCDSMDTGERCSSLNTSGLDFIQKCQDDRRTCMVSHAHVSAAFSCGFVTGRFFCMHCGFTQYTRKFPLNKPIWNRVFSPRDM
jgi:hypothetical protein